LTSDGKLGIGTDSPQALLTVNGNAAIGTGVTSSNSSQVVVGKYNDTRTNDSGTNHTQGVFIVGSGASASPGLNAIRVTEDGTILVKRCGDLSMGSYVGGQQP
jgi:hypothetical protein